MAKVAQFNALSKQTISNIFLAKTPNLSNGNKMIPLELKNNKINYSFYQSISGNSANQLKAYWTNLVFAGIGKPPKTVFEPQNLALQSQSIKSAIAYVEESQVTNDMKIIHRIH